jgi:hypothetical protein
MTQKHTPKHSPLPWVKSSEKSEDYFYHGWFILDAKNHSVADCIQEDESAEFIVRACNSHYELLEALMLADALLSGKNMNKQIVEKKVKAAIAKATGAK